MSTTYRCRNTSRGSARRSTSCRPSWTLMFRRSQEQVFPRGSRAIICPSWMTTRHQRQWRMTVGQASPTTGLLQTPQTHSRDQGRQRGGETVRISLTSYCNRYVVWLGWFTSLNASPSAPHQITRHVLSLDFGAVGIDFQCSRQVRLRWQHGAAGLSVAPLRTTWGQKLALGIALSLIMAVSGKS